MCPLVASGKEFVFSSCILEQEMVFSFFSSKPRVIPRCSSDLNWSAKPPVLNQEERKHVWCSTNSITSFPIWGHPRFCQCFSTVASLPFTSRPCLKKLLLAGVPRRKGAYPFTYTLLGQSASFSLWSSEVYSASCPLTAGIHAITVQASYCKDFASGVQQSICSKTGVSGYVYREEISEMPKFYWKVIGFRHLKKTHPQQHYFPLSL